MASQPSRNGPRLPTLGDAALEKGECVPLAKAPEPQRPLVGENEAIDRVSPLEEELDYMAPDEARPARHRNPHSTSVHSHRRGMILSAHNADWRASDPTSKAVD